ncbi:hypothetical protein K8S17_01310 [bacterium]|nr:hypothetical protein [bacterium]
MAYVDVRADFIGGAGREITMMPGRSDKFCAAHSSAALAANTFGPFRCSPGDLTLLGMSGFSATRFEKQLRTGLGGTPPNLDFFAYGTDAIIAVEGKFTEMLSTGAARFSPSYSRAVADLASPAWADLYDSLCSDPRRFRFLDAAQLVKHYLGIRYSQ